MGAAALVVANEERKARRQPEPQCSANTVLQNGVCVPVFRPAIVVLE
jgi:hypothetical protein